MVTKPDPICPPAALKSQLPEMGLGEGGNFKHKVPGTPDSRSGAAPPLVPERRAGSGTPAATQPRGRQAPKPPCPTRALTRRRRHRRPWPLAQPLAQRAGRRSPEARRVPGGRRRRAPHSPRDAAPPSGLRIGQHRRLCGSPLAQRRGPDWGARVT